MIPLGPAMAEAIVSRRKHMSKTKPVQATMEPTTTTTKPVQTRKRTALLIPVGPSKLAKPKQSDLLPKKSENPEEIYYTCEMCPMAFNKKFNRDRHMEVMHGVSVSTRNRPLYPDKIQDNHPIPEPKLPVQELPLPTKTILKKAMEPTKTVEPEPTKPDAESEEMGKPKSDVEPESDDESTKSESIVDSVETDGEPTKPESNVEPMETTDMKQESCDNCTILQKPLNKEVCVTILVTTK